MNDRLCNLNEWQTPSTEACDAHFLDIVSTWVIRLVVDTVSFSSVWGFVQTHRPYQSSPQCCTWMWLYIVQNFGLGGWGHRIQESSTWRKQPCWGACSGTWIECLPNWFPLTCLSVHEQMGGKHLKYRWSLCSSSGKDAYQLVLFPGILSLLRQRFLKCQRIAKKKDGTLGKQKNLSFIWV